MWKTNGAGSRGFSFALNRCGTTWDRSIAPLQRARHAFWRCNGPATRFRHAQAGLLRGQGSVSDTEFLQALNGVLPLPKRNEESRAVGIAVSGGVDSMALATLYARCSDAGLPPLHGFIIDHKARPESTEEAHWVAQELSTLGLQSTIVPLTWPEGFDLNDTSRFESEARKLRYQALGRACSDKDIASLLIAHHADDQVETLLMRLIHGRLRSGLQGMKPVEWIPECYGIHGVHHSGGPVPKGDPTLSLVEHGGIQILRPLLAFQKSRLVATCEEHNTRWAEDRTNHDRTLTLRNALRYIITKHKLPKALSTESILAIAHTTCARIEKHQVAAKSLFDACPIKLDIRVGAVTIRLPPAAALFPTSTSAPSESDKVYARNTAYYLLWRVAELVSPNEKAVVESLANAVLSVYPSLTPSSSNVSARQLDTFSCNNCWWNKASASSAFSISPPDTPIAQLNEWTLSRLPSSKMQAATSTLMFPGNSRSAWQLFDGRFWVRIHNRQSHPVVLKLLSDAQLGHVLRFDMDAKLKGDPFCLEGPRHDRDRDRYIYKVLSTLKPHTLRRHLPALFRAPASSSGDEDTEMELLALPTLQSSKKMSQAVSGRLECTWEVKYKKIDTGERTLGQLIERKGSGNHGSGNRPGRRNHVAR